MIKVSNKPHIFKSKFHHKWLVAPCIGCPRYILLKAYAFAMQANESNSLSSTIKESQLESRDHDTNIS